MKDAVRPRSKAKRLLPAFLLSGTTSHLGVRGQGFDSRGCQLRVTLGKSTKAQKERAKRRRLEETLIPGLPRDLSMECLAKVPFFFHPELSLVSGSWRDVLQSPDLFSIRTRSGAVRNFLCACLGSRPQATSWFLLDPNSSPRFIVQLPPPPIPVVNPSFATIGPLLFAIGGCVGKTASPAVQIYDAQANQWRLGPPMQTARVFAAAGAIEGQFYVAEGFYSSQEPWGEVFDPQEETWLPLTRPAAEREKWIPGTMLAMADHGALQFDSEAEVDRSVARELHRNWRLRSAVVEDIVYFYDYSGKLRGFDLESKKWRMVKIVNPNLDSLPRSLFHAITVNLDGIVCVVWISPRSEEIMCAGIKMEKKEQLRGEILWKVFNIRIPLGSFMSHCVVLQI